MSDISLVVLAGGKSSRMNGEDKATKPYHGKPMICRVLEQFKGLVNESVVVVRDAMQEKDVKEVVGKLPGLSIATDEVRDFGPTAGMAAGFAAASGEHCFLAACDMPFIVPPVARHIISRCMEVDAAVPRWENGLMEPMFACYRRKPTLNAARLAIESGFGKIVVPMYELSDIVWISIEEELRPLDAELTTFKNVNTPKEWGQAKD